MRRLPRPVVLACAIVACSSGSSAPQVADPAKPPILFTAGTIHLGAVTTTIIDVSNAKTKSGRCAIQTIEACNVIDCRASAGSDFKPVLAGDFTASGGAADPLTVGADPATGWYSAVTKVGSALWPPGTAVKLDLAGGADIPAFSATFTMPPAPTLTSPQVAADGSSSIDHASPLDVAWTGGSSGPSSFYVTIIQQKGGDTAMPPSFVDVYCILDGSAGRTTVPAAAMAMLAPTSAGSTTTLFGAGNGSVSVLVEGGYPTYASVVNVVGGAVVVR